MGIPKVKYSVERAPDSKSSVILKMIGKCILIAVYWILRVILIAITRVLWLGLLTIAFMIAYLILIFAGAGKTGKYLKSASERLAISKY